MISQVLLNGLIAGSNYALVALGFALIYSVTRFFNFAHGGIYTAGAYFTLTFFVFWKIPFIFAAIFAVLLAGLLGIGIEYFIYKPMHRKNSTNPVLLLTSLGIFIIIQNCISLVFGNEIKSIRNSVQEGYIFFGARITEIQIIIIVVSLLLFIITTIGLKYSRFGKVLRAVASDQHLAVTVGIDTQKVRYATFFLGSSLAALAAILISLDVDMNPLMGMNALLFGVVAVIIGGLGNILGAYFGGILLGFAQHLGVWYTSSIWQDAIAFLILIVFLLFRPQGFFGKKLKKSQI